MSDDIDLFLSERPQTTEESGVATAHAATDAEQRQNLLLL